MKVIKVFLQLLLLCLLVFTFEGENNATKKVLFSATFME